MLETSKYGLSLMIASKTCFCSDGKTAINAIDSSVARGNQAVIEAIRGGSNSEIGMQRPRTRQCFSSFLQCLDEITSA